MRDRRDDKTHRNVAAAKLGRPLAPGEVAHHVDEDKTNNRPDNVDVKSRKVHTADHNANRDVSKVRAALRMVKERKKLY